MHRFRQSAHQVAQVLIDRLGTAPLLVLLPALGLAGVALWYTITALEFETSRNALASSQARYVEIERALKDDFDHVDNLVVVVEPPSLERGKQFVQELATRLRADTQHFEEVVERIDTSSLEGKKLLYLSADELRALRQRLADAQDFLAGLSESPGLVPLLGSINQEISKALVTHITGSLLGEPAPSASTDAATTTPEPSLDVSFLGALFSEMAQALAAPGTYLFHSPWEHFFLEDGEVFAAEGYLTSKNHRFFFVLVNDRTTPGSFVKHARPIAILRAHLLALQHEFPDVQAGVTGSDALNSDEMVAAQRDTLLGTLIALIGVAILFIAAFRQVLRPLLVVVTLVVALCWTLGLTTLVVGHLNILSVTFVPILIGLGIDFGIHLVARFSEERARQHDFSVAMRTALLHTGPGIAAAACTTALAFYAITLTDFRGLVELGFIAGSGMLICLLAGFTVLPALLALSERHKQVPAGVWQPLRRDPLARLKRFPRTLLGALTLLTLAGALLIPMPGFDYNLLNLQAHGTESVEWEYRLLEESGRSSWYALSLADSLQELHDKKTRFEALPAVDRVASLVSVLPVNQDARLPLVKALAPYVDDISVDWQGAEPIDLDEMTLILQKIRFKLQRDTRDWDPSKRPSEGELAQARQALLVLQERLQSTPAATARAALETFQQALMRDFAAKVDVLKRNVNPTPITMADVPAYLQDRYLGTSGRYLLQIFARDNIWERQAMQAFVTQLHSVDANATGAPVIAYYAIGQMQRGYTRGVIYAFIATVVVVLLLFRRLRPAVLALTPMLFGGLWTLGCMALLGMQFNMANLIILPLFLGIAVDNGIHLVHRMREHPEDALQPLTRSTGKAIVLTSLTSMVGFGSLMVAHHAGVFSLGLLTALSVGFALIATLVILPLMLRLLPLPPTPQSPVGPPPTTTVSGPSSSR